jgi:hypothetical protein
MIKSTIQGLLIAAIALGASASEIPDDEDGGHLHGVWRMNRMGVNCQQDCRPALPFRPL